MPGTTIANDLNDVAKRLVSLLRLIRPHPPGVVDFSANEKAILYDRARNVLYDETGTVRPLDGGRLSRGASAVVIAGLSAISWAILTGVARAFRSIL